jgi:CheY-like chemotaxis protein
MTATILVVDDEPDLQALVLQKFRKQIRGGAVTFVFAHDGIEALQSIADHRAGAKYAPKLKALRVH